MTNVRLVCIAMAGNEYALWDRDGTAATGGSEEPDAPAGASRLTFPHGDVRDGESPADAARRVVEEWTKTKAPKLELVDMLAEKGALTLVFRAMLIDEPQGVAKRAKRMELPEKVGALSGKYVEDALKTSLNYKLTRA